MFFASAGRCALVLSLLTGLPFFQHAALAASVVDADEALGLCHSDSLPQDVRNTLDRRFYGWKVQEANNLLPKARQKWATVTPLACPGIAAGKFEDSRSVAYALLLVPSDPSANGYKFVVFSAPAGQSFYGFKMLDQGNTNASGTFIHALPVERVFDADLKKKFKPKGSDVVLLAYSDEKSSLQDAFYWSGATYEHAQIDF